MNHLLRELAPIDDAVWKVLDEEARTRLAPALGARTLVDFTGPFGWQHSATSLGRTSEAIAAAGSGVSVRTRSVLPLVEVRTDFSLPRAELEAAARGAADVDLGRLDNAAATMAVLENTAILAGWAEAGFTGIAEASPHQSLPRPGDPARLAQTVAAAVAALRRAGVGGPYGLAADEETWILLNGANDAGGYPLLAHVEHMLGGGAVAWSPGAAHPVLLSLRGGDYLFECGQDISIGYSSTTPDTVDLYLEETFSFRVATPEAAVAIR
jgi:uncharacterized linocin/CFP29 family protein